MLPHFVEWKNSHTLKLFYCRNEFRSVSYSLRLSYCATSVFIYFFFYFFTRTKTIYNPSYRIFFKFKHLKGLKGILKIDLYLGPRFEDEILIKLLRWRHEVWTWNFALRSASLWVSWCEFPYCYTFLREKQVNSLITVFF